MVIVNFMYVYICMIVMGKFYRLVHNNSTT